jgi:hypothetical protein
VSFARRLICFSLGFAAVSLLDATFGFSPASAQTASVNPPSGATQRRPAPPPRRQQIPGALVDQAPSPVAPVARSPLDNTTEGHADASDQAQDDTRQHVPKLPQDGDMSDGVVMRDSLDGSGDPVEGTGPQDGDDPEKFDQRNPADAAAFERPAAGYDALAFQVEDVAPILDRRPARLARFEPYDPVGIRRGSWIIYPEAEFGAGATSNILRSPQRSSALSFDVRPTLRAVTAWRQHAVEVSGTGLASFYGNGFASENDRSYTFEARTRIDMSRRTNVVFQASTARSQDGRGNPDAPDAARERSDVDTNRVAAALNHRFNRLSLQLRGSYTDADFGSVATRVGGIISNAERDNVNREVAVRAAWAFKPSFSPFVEVARSDRTFKAAAADGLRRDSDGQRYRFGLSFGEASRIWSGEVALGYGRETAAYGALAPLSGVILDANLGWRPSAVTSFLFTARTDFTSSNTAGTLGAHTQQIAVEGRHAFQQHLIGTAVLRHSVADYKGIDLTERETAGELGLEYFLNSRASVLGRYTHLVFDSSTAGADYKVDTVRLGMRIRQ